MQLGLKSLKYYATEGSVKLVLSDLQSDIFQIIYWKLIFLLILCPYARVPPESSISVVGVGGDLFIVNRTENRSFILNCKCLTLDKVVPLFFLKRNKHHLRNFEGWSVKRIEASKGLGDESSWFKKIYFPRVVVFHYTQSNDSRQNNAQFMHKLCFSLHATNRLTIVGGHSLYRVEMFKDYTE